MRLMCLMRLMRLMRWTFGLDDLDVLDVLDVLDLLDLLDLPDILDFLDLLDIAKLCSEKISLIAFHCQNSFKNLKMILHLILRAEMPRSYKWTGVDGLGWKSVWGDSMSTALRSQ